MKQQNRMIMHQRCFSAAYQPILVILICLTSVSAQDAIGVWTNVSPSLTGTYRSAECLLVDPVRPSDIYSFLQIAVNSGECIVIKSTDFGRTWGRVSTTYLNGDSWGAAIDPRTNRDPTTPPTMYTTMGYGYGGIWKSTDGGVTWSNCFSGSTAFDNYGTDFYSVEILPDNIPNHILTTYHYGFKNMSESGFGESTDGGTTWQVHLPPLGIGTSHYFMIVNSQTWIAISQETEKGTWITTTAGRVGGAISTAAWRKVDDHSHMHGQFKSYTDPDNGYIYAPGYGGIKRTTDRGETWQWVYQNGAYVGTVVGTQRYLYSDYYYGPVLRRAPKSTGTGWVEYTQVPSGMNNGTHPLSAVTTFDGTHWVILYGCQTSGIWRYVEPASSTVAVNHLSKNLSQKIKSSGIKLQLLLLNSPTDANGKNAIYDVKGQRINSGRIGKQAVIVGAR